MELLVGVAELKPIKLVGEEHNYTSLGSIVLDLCGSVRGYLESICGHCSKSWIW